jgi:hypothetical protein
MDDLHIFGSALLVFRRCSCLLFPLMSDVTPISAIDAAQCDHQMYMSIGYSDK